MKKILCQILLLLIIVLGSCSKKSEKITTAEKSLISLRHQYLRAGISNYFKVITHQNNLVSINAFQWDGSKKTPVRVTKNSKNGFTITPDTTGIIEIKIDLGDTIETKTLGVKLLKAVGRLGRYGGSDSKIGINEFKKQYGVIAYLECCDIDARCKIQSYEVMRINSKNGIETILNKRGKFEENTKKLILKAEYGDLYIFRKIKYRCPGPRIIQRLENMVFEID